eukprot:CAMPEP_0178736048 /NCGR_PEP_ID=MMETSP0744-20121128/2225_1 /TAXON_ID=913974 /ORGANISM="Nitzschia punctata, Strain CCMP561" /LENGTH=85 /DNA_ID=CAMNT_0020388481 /DNA_START=96 /DNA_END=350 /DNA_ORIENTATION=-
MARSINSKLNTLLCKANGSTGVDEVKICAANEKLLGLLLLASSIPGNSFELSLTRDPSDNTNPCTTRNDVDGADGQDRVVVGFVA